MQSLYYIATPSPQGAMLKLLQLQQLLDRSSMIWQIQLFSWIY